MISVIVPVYNVEKYLHRCVDSIIAQTFTDFELILVDDGSTDNSGKICDEYAEKDKRIMVFHTDNKGPSSARNTGLDYAFSSSKSKWISFIDSDDWVHPFYLEYLYDAAVKSKLKISSCTLKRVSSYCIDIINDLTFTVESSEKVYTDFYSHALAYPVGRLFKKECFENVRFPDNRFFEDVYLMYKVLLSVEEIAYIRDALYYYFVNENGTVHKPWNQQRMDGCWAYEEQLAYLSQHPEFIKTYKVIQNDYMLEISYSFFKLRDSDFNEKEKYLRILSLKMRKALKKYKKSTSVSLKKNTSYYDVAYPKLMNYYWKYVSIKNKLLKEE